VHGPRKGIAEVSGLLFLAGCAVGRSTAADPVQTPQHAGLEMPFLAADISRSFEPFRYLQGFGDAGIAFFGAEKLFWNDFEAEPFSGYDWEAYDAVIREVESIGGDILPTIWSISTWTTAVRSAEPPASAPRPEYRERCAGFVRALHGRVRP
jgi:hypothetical protein